jgi:hypothetical protein
MILAALDGMKSANGMEARQMIRRGAPQRRLIIADEIKEG